MTNLATVTEYMVNGSLQQVLCRKDRSDNISFVNFNQIFYKLTICFFIIEYVENRLDSSFTCVNVLYVHYYTSPYIKVK